MASTKDFKAFGQDIQKRLTELESRTANMLTKTTADGLYLGKTATAAAASKLTTNAGTATNPVYFANGVPVKTTYALEKSVPADAKFTDTWRGIQDNLTSTSTKDSLSANQGKILKDSLDALSSNTVVDISASGTTITVTKGDNSTSTFDTQDTKYTAASASNLGLVKVGSNITRTTDGTISITKANVTSALGYTPPTTNTEYGNFSGATASAAGKSGLVPAPTLGKTNQVLRSNGTWGDETVQTTITGNAGSATKLQTARNISLTGDTTATATDFDGSKDISLSTTLATVTTAGTIGSSTNETLSHGGTFTVPYVTKVAKGRVTGGGTRTMTMPAAQTTITGNAGSATKLATARNISISGDVAGTATAFDGSKDISIEATVATLKGATSSVAGAKGLVPAPTTSDIAKYLKGDGTWGTPNQTSVTGNAGTATKLQHARTIALSGAVTGTATSFDGSANITIPTTSVDGTKVTGIVPKATADASGNNIINTYAKKADVYTKSEVDSKVSGIYSYKGTVDSYDELPTTDVKTGDVYNIGTALDGKNYAAIVDSEGGITWDDIGGKVDLSSYVTKTEANNAYLAKSATASSATKLAAARTISLTGDTTGSVSFDGSANASIKTTLANSGVTAGTYGPTAAATLSFGGSVNVPYAAFDSKGRATKAGHYVIKLPAAPTSVSGNAGTATKLATGRNISLTGDVTGTATAFDGSANASISATLANSGVTAGKYGPTAAATIAFGGSINIPYTEFDAKGRAISATHYAIKFPSAPTTVSGNAGSATKLQTARYIDGVSFNGTADIANYGTCSTAAATKDKVVACTGFALKTGARIIVKFTITNTVTPTAAAPITLNVNGTGAKSIFYHGSATWSAGYLSANRLVEFVYDGTQYAVVGDWDTNNRYNNMTAATATAAGKAGLVPAPAAGKHTAFLRGDGTWAVPENTTYPAATDSVLGLVKVGSNITNSSGTISLTKANVTSALGYTPPTTNTTYTKGDYDTLGLIKPSKSYTSAAKLTTAAASAATAPTIAAISTTAGRYYAVEQDVNGVPFVNVPWVNTTSPNMTAASSTAAGKAGLVPAPAAGAQGKFLRGDGTWQTPANTNNAVTQTVKSDNVNYPIIAKGTNATATVTGGVNFAAAITLNPSTGTINAKKFNGALDAANLTGTIDGGTL